MARTVFVTAGIADWGLHCALSCSSRAGRSLPGNTCQSGYGKVPPLISSLFLFRNGQIKFKDV